MAGLIAPIVESVKALYDQITTHGEDIQALKTENADLKARLEILERKIATESK